MKQPAHKTEGVNCTKTMRFYPFIFTGNDPRKGWRIPLNEIKYNEQRDAETGYGYFGARYMDHELMTMWLSVDPMADKYPGISPYNYCMWTRPTGGDEHRWIKYNIVNNPVKLVDPEGMECGDYYTKAGKWVGTDNQQDGNVYLCTGKNAKGEFDDVKKISITHREFRKTAATVYGESSAYKYKVTSKN